MLDLLLLKWLYAYWPPLKSKHSSHFHSVTNKIIQLSLWKTVSNDFSYLSKYCITLSHFCKTISWYTLLCLKGGYLRQILMSAVDFLTFFACLFRCLFALYIHRLCHLAVDIITFFCHLYQRFCNWYQVHIESTGKVYWRSRVPWTKLLPDEDISVIKY